jgi:hypothetical protein
VVHRVSGSSSTAGVSEYLYGANVDSPDVSCRWALNHGQSTVNWPAGTFSLGTPDYVDGSDGMAAYLEENPYSVGYLDFGHGHTLGLSEVALQNTGGYVDARRGLVSSRAVSAAVLVRRRRTTRLRMDVCMTNGCQWMHMVATMHACMSERRGGGSRRSDSSPPRRRTLARQLLWRWRTACSLPLPLTAGSM